MSEYLNLDMGKKAICIAFVSMLSLLQLTALFFFSGFASNWSQTRVWKRSLEINVRVVTEVPFLLYKLPFSRKLL